MKADIVDTRHGHTLEYNDKRHIYRLDGKIIPSVTTINKKGYPESEALIRWRIKQGIKEFETGHKAKAAASIGTLTHEYAYYVDRKLDAPADLIDRIAKHKDSDKVMNCISHFKAWKSENDDDILASEAIVCAPLDELWYAGSFDRLAHRGSRVVLSDFKTSSGIYVDQFVQLAGYVCAIKYWLGIEVQDIEIVRFGKTDDTFETKLVSDQKEIDIFIDQFNRNLRTYDFRTKYEGI